MNDNLTILKKGLVLLSIPFVFQIAFIGLLVKINADGVRAQRWAIHSKEVIARAESAFRKLVEGHSGVRAFLLTGDAAFQSQAIEVLGRARSEVDGLENLVEDNPPQRVRARDVAARAGRLAAWVEETGRLAQAGRREEAIDRVRGLSGMTLLTDVRNGLDEFLGAEARLEAERSADLDAASTRQSWALAAGGLLSALGVVVVATIYGRSITRRFSTLADNAGRLAEGRELVPPLGGRDEIGQLDRVFHGMARAIAEKNQEIEMFVYSVSHDLRSPLVNLQGFSQELGRAAEDLRRIIEGASLSAPTEKRALAIMDEDVAGSIHFIQTAVTRLSVIIDALLRLSRAGRVEYRWQPVDVAATVDRVVKALQGTIAERSATVSAAADLPEAWGDPAAVEQVFANLIGNAVNYLDPQRPGIVEVGALLDGDGPTRTFYVKDNGLGVPEAGMAKLFHAFQRFHDGAARGEGIGLALTRRIVERHGGGIRVESQPGVGSVFFVDLPIRPTEPEAGETARRQPFNGKGPFT